MQDEVVSNCSMTYHCPRNCENNIKISVGMFRCIHFFTKDCARMRNGRKFHSNPYFWPWFNLKYWTYTLNCIEQFFELLLKFYLLRITLLHYWRKWNLSLPLELKYVVHREQASLKKSIGDRMLSFTIIVMYDKVTVVRAIYKNYGIMFSVIFEKLICRQDFTNIIKNLVLQ